MKNCNIIIRVRVGYVNGNWLLRLKDLGLCIQISNAFPPPPTIFLTVAAPPTKIDRRSALLQRC